MAGSFNIGAVPVQGYGPPSLAVIAAGVPYMDTNGQALWQPTRNPNVYKRVTGGTSANSIFADITTGSVVLTKAGSVVSGFAVTGA